MEKNSTPTERLLVELHQATAAFAEGALWDGYAGLIRGQGATEYYALAEECFARGYVHLSDAVGFASLRLLPKAREAAEGHIVELPVRRDPSSETGEYNLGPV